MVQVATDDAVQRVDGSLGQDVVVVDQSSTSVNGRLVMPCASATGP